MKYFLFIVIACVVMLSLGCENQIPQIVDGQIVTSGDSTSSVVPTKPITQAELKEKVFAITDASACSKYSWKDRGTATKGYFRGMGLTYAKNYCHPVAIVSVARNLPESKYDATDVLSWYNSNFRNAGLTNDTSGTDTQRHVWTLLIGLGMRESSGKYCEGRDMAANNVTAETAESGMMQTSWNSRSAASEELLALYKKYKDDKKNCNLDIFKEKVTCKAGNTVYGTGEGATWQTLQRECPAFAAEWAAIVVRRTGGTKGHYGPLRTKKAELKIECHQMLTTVEELVTTNNACSVL